MPFEKLAPKSPDDYADAGSTNGSHADDRCKGFCDDGVRDAQQQAKEQAHRPARPWQPGRAYDEPNPEPRDKSRRDGSPFIRKAHRQHNSNVYGAEHQSAEDAEGDSGHVDSLGYSRFSK